MRISSEVGYRHIKLDLLLLSVLALDNLHYNCMITLCVCVSRKRLKLPSHVPNI